MATFQRGRALLWGIAVTAALALLGGVLMALGSPLGVIIWCLMPFATGFVTALYLHAIEATMLSIVLTVWLFAFLWFGFFVIIGPPIGAIAAVIVRSWIWKRTAP